MNETTTYHILERKVNNSNDILFAVPAETLSGNSLSSKVSQHFYRAGEVELTRDDFEYAHQTDQSVLGLFTTQAMSLPQDHRIRMAQGLLELCRTYGNRLDCEAVISDEFAISVLLGNIKRTGNIYVVRVVGTGRRDPRESVAEEMLLQSCAFFVVNEKTSPAPTTNQEPAEQPKPYALFGQNGKNPLMDMAGEFSAQYAGKVTVHQRVFNPSFTRRNPRIVLATKKSLYEYIKSCERTTVPSTAPYAQSERPKIC